MKFSTKSIALVGMFLLAILGLSQPATAQNLPDPMVRPLPSSTDWFDGFTVGWWKNSVTPCTLQLVNSKSITVTKNYVENVRILSVDLTEYQESEDSPNYGNSQLVVTLDIEMGVGSFYTLTVPAGALNVNYNGTWVPNEKIEYTFQLKGSGAATVPEPVVSPAPGEVEELESVSLSWKGFEVMRQTDGWEGFKKPITMTVNGGEPREIESFYIGEESVAMWNHYPAIGLSVNAVEDGEYVITIPGDCLQIGNENTGTIYLMEPIVLKYTVTGLGEAPSIIPVTPRVSPSDGYVGGPVGVVSVTWPGVRLVMDSQDKDIKTPVDPSFVTVKVNGNEIAINPDETGGGRIWVKAQYGSDGASTEWRVDDQLLIELPDMFFFWIGNVEIAIKEGAVMSVDGAVNAPIKVSYTFTGIDYNVIWEPAPSSEGENVNFKEKDCVITASWAGYDDIKVNPRASLSPFYQKATEEDNGAQTPATKYMNIVGGKVVFDFSSFGEGSYILCIPENYLTLAEGVANGEAVFNFAIMSDSAVEGVFENSEVYTVYSLQGIKVLETSEKDSLRQLTPGLYIINGRKLRIR